MSPFSFEHGPWHPTPEFFAAERHARLARRQRHLVILTLSSSKGKDLRGRLSPRRRELLFGFAVLAAALFLSWLVVRFP